ncbi:MAG: hypothetical protein ACREKH_14160, partial [Candidatus Rokuibacteriota bacterium]
EADRVRTLPARRVDPYDGMLEALDETARRRLDGLVVEIRAAVERGMQGWLATGRLLAEAKKLLLKKGDFGRWVERNGMDRAHAHRFIEAWTLVESVPAALSPTLVKVGQHKIALLSRLAPAKRLEVLEHGVALNGGEPQALEQVTYRQLNAYVQSVVGKSARGRKGKGAPAAKPKERLGLPVEVVEAFQGALQHLGTLAKKAKLGWSDKERPAARRFWSNVNHLFFKLQDDLGMAALLEGGR